MNRPLTRVELDAALPMVRRDSLGRRRHYLQDNNRNPAIYKVQANCRITTDMQKALRAVAKRDKTTVAIKIREYLEWGLENDKVD
jgi:hypothetical protein